MGNAVLWHAEIRTLTYHCRLLNIAATPIQQFIDISLDKIEASPSKTVMTLGLNLEMINHAAILSSIILIRQYKNLKPGLHKYGEIICIQ